MSDIEQIIGKMFITLTLFWMAYESEVIRAEIKYKRLQRFLRRILWLIYLYIGWRILSALVDTFILGQFTSWLSYIGSFAFFGGVALVLRFRRQTLVNEWKNVPEVNAELYDQAIDKVGEAVKTLTQ